MTNGTQTCPADTPADDTEDRLADLWGQVEDAIYGYAALRGIPSTNAADALAELFEDLR